MDVRRGVLEFDSYLRRPARLREHPLGYHVCGSSWLGRGQYVVLWKGRRWMDRDQCQPDQSCQRHPNYRIEHQCRMAGGSWIRVWHEPELVGQARIRLSRVEYVECEFQPLRSQRGSLQRQTEYPDIRG